MKTSNLRDDCRMFKHGSLFDQGTQNEGILADTELVSGDFCAVAECLIGGHIFELHGDPVIGITTWFGANVQALFLGIEFAAFDAQELDGFCECGVLELHLGEDDLVRLDLGGACFPLGLQRAFLGRRLGIKRFAGGGIDETRGDEDQGVLGDVFRL